MRPHERILVALDTPDAERAAHLARRLAGHVGGVKVGLELFSAAGPQIVERMRELDLDVFLDLKLHDIPNTVAGATRAAVRRGVRWFTVHAQGGPAMLRAAAAAAREAVPNHRTAPMMLAVTILTSLGDADLPGLGVAGPCTDAVRRLAGLARDAGAGGIVCSPLEISGVRAVFPEATLVVPGVRPRGYGKPDDQTRTATPRDAVLAGADLLVIGRPITANADPVHAAESIAQDIAGERHPS